MGGQAVSLEMTVKIQWQKREIRLLKQRIKRLEEAGDEMCSEFQAFCPLGSKTRDKWRKAKEAKP